MRQTSRYGSEMNDPSIRTESLDEQNLMEEDYWYRQRTASMYLVVHGHMQWEECPDTCPGKDVEIIPLEHGDQRKLADILREYEDQIDE